MTATPSIDRAAEARDVLARLGVDATLLGDGGLTARTPISGKPIAQARGTTVAQAAETATAARKAFLAWREVPAPKRCELVRPRGEEPHAHNADLGRLVSINVG